MVVMITVLCFLEKPEETFREVYRVLMHEGKAFLLHVLKKEGSLQSDIWPVRIRGGFFRMPGFMGVMR